MAVFYMAAGVNHFINPDFYLKNDTNLDTLA